MREMVASLEEALRRLIDDFWQAGLILDEMLQCYGFANDISLHSRLQTALLLAGWDCGFASFPEVRLRLNKPIDRWALEGRRRKTRYQRTVRVDVGYYKEGLCGVGEVVTLDGAHEANPSIPRITTYQKLRHIAQNYDVFFLILIALPQQVKEPPPWKEWREWKGADEDKRQKIIQCVERMWVRLAEEIRSELGKEAFCFRLKERAEIVKL